MQNIDKNLEGLRDALFDELNLFRAGKVDNAHVRSVGLLADRILRAATLDLFASGQMEEPKKVKQLNGSEKV